MPYQPTLPEFIHQPVAAWPFSTRLVDCHLVTASFDPAGQGEPEFARYGLTVTGSNGKRQCEFLAGRLCAAQALHNAGNHFSLLGRDPLTGRPQWPNGWHGSITHSHGQAAAVVAPADTWRGIGLDLERLIATQRAQRLRHAVLGETEQHWLKSTNAENDARILTLIFSAKESLFKALNPLTGVYFGFQDAKVTSLEQSGEVTLQLNRDLSGDYRAGMEFSCQWTPFAHGVLTLVYLPA